MTNISPLEVAFHGIAHTPAKSFLKSIKWFNAQDRRQPIEDEVDSDRGGRLSPAFRRCINISAVFIPAGSGSFDQPGQLLYISGHCPETRA
jgi:hypothetical protein